MHLFNYVPSVGGGVDGDVSLDVRDLELVEDPEGAPFIPDGLQGHGGGGYCGRELVCDERELFKLSCL